MIPEKDVRDFQPPKKTGRPPKVKPEQSSGKKRGKSSPATDKRTTGAVNADKRGSTSKKKGGKK
jgi:hypothetical protein